MDRSTRTLERIGTPVAYFVAGGVGTAAAALVALNLLESIQPAVYDLLYLRLGPSEATKVAVLAHFLVAATVGISVPLLASDCLSDRGENLPALVPGVAALLGLVAVFLLATLAGGAPFLAALLALAVALVGLPLALRYWMGVRSGGLPAFAGGIPVVLALLFLAGFGIGWGWGYVVTAQEVPRGAVTEPVAEFDEVPEVRDDLFADGDCETTDDGRQCRLQLRGYEHERTAARFMARHGVRCPFRNTHAGEADAFVAEYDGTPYRVTCSPHGD